MMSTRPPRLSIDPSTNLPSIHSFGALSQFLRGAVADEDSRQLSESMGHLAGQIESIVGLLRLHRERDMVAPQLVDLLTVLREHRNFVVGLGAHWGGLHEYAPYLQSLNNFRVLIGQWLLSGPSEPQLSLAPEDFELMAWRLLGEGMLLIDMYDQWSAEELADSTPAALDGLDETQSQRSIHWWKKLRL